MIITFARKAVSPGSRSFNIVKTTTRSKSFRMSTGQRATIYAAIENAKGRSGSKTSTAALVFICRYYLGRQKLAERRGQREIEKALAAATEDAPSSSVVYGETEITEGNIEKFGV